MFSVLGTFYGGLVMMRLVAGESTPIINAIGTYFGLSRSFTSLTVMVWSMETETLVTNVALARRGYAQMAFRSCFSITIVGKAVHNR